jgi:cell division protein FtsL
VEKRSRAEYRRNSRNVSKVPYEYGSAVRQLNIAEPLKTPDESQQRQKQIRRNNKINLMYTVAVASVAAVVFFICYQYLNVQATAKTNSDVIAELKSELSTLKENNDVLESDINASIDYDAIYDTAVNELGMVYPEKKQVITYDSKESEYVKQYKDVPESN